MRGYRSNASWKYRVIKHLRHRAETFRDEATNGADRAAWTQVVAWLNSFRDRYRVMTPKGAIGIDDDGVGQ